MGICLIARVTVAVAMLRLLNQGQGRAAGLAAVPLVAPPTRLAGVANRRPGGQAVRECRRGVGLLYSIIIHTFVN